MKTKDRQVLLHLVLVLLAVISLLPIVFALSSSLKDLEEPFNNVLSSIPKSPTLSSYLYVFSRLPLFKIIFNTSTVVFIVTTVEIITSVLTNYSLVYYDFKGKNFIYLVFLATMFVPFIVTMTPSYLIISKLGLTDNIWGVMLPQFADVLGIFLLRQSMWTIPKSIIEVAKTDGVGGGHILLDIILPILRPSMISAAVIFFINSWNGYVWPVLIISSQDHYTLSLALRMFIPSRGGTEFPTAMAVSVITMTIPLILFLPFQRHIMSTFISSDVK